MNKKISAYLKFNLFNFFHHPLFYILGICFSVFTSAYFLYRQQFFSGNGTTDLLSFFSTVPYICILIIPALCYKRSDYIYNDFIPLSYFYKITTRFLSILIIYSIYIFVLLPIPIFVNFFGIVDPGQIFTSLLCLLFYGAAVISLCIFFTELFENGITSFIFSAIFLAIFNSSHIFTVYVNLNNYLSSFCKLISFAWHFDAAGKGIIDTRDLFWLLGITGLNLFITTMIKYYKNGKVFTKKNKIQNILIFTIFILFLMNSTRWYKRFDLSINKTYSISEYSKTLLNNAQSNIKITYYRSGVLEEKYPQVRDISDFLITYSTYSKNMNIVIKDPDKDENSKNLLQTYGVMTQPMQYISNNKVEYMNIYSAITIEYNGNTELIPYILSAQTLEYDLDGRLKHLLTNNYRIVNIVIGNGLGLNDQRGYNYLIPWLNSQGFVCYAIDVTDPDFSAKLSNTTGPLLVIGDNSLNINCAVAIESYILSKKGNGLFLISPYSFDFDQWLLTQNMNTNIVEMIENWGITFTDKIVADMSCSIITMESTSSEEELFSQNSTYRENVNYPLFINLLPQTNSTLGATLFWTTALELKDSQYIKPYLYSSQYSWNYTVDTTKQKLIETIPEFYKSQDYTSFETSPQIIGAQITGPINGLFTSYSCDSSNIIVIPDQYFVNTLTTFGVLGNEYRNFDLLTNCLLKLNNEEELAQLQSRSSRDITLTKITETYKFNQFKKITNIFVFVIIPLVYLLTFILIILIHNWKIKNEKN